MTKQGNDQLVMFQHLFNATDSAESEEKKKIFEQGYTKARLELKEQVMLLEKMSKKLTDEKKELLERMKPEVIEFCILLTEQVIRQQLSDPTIFATMVHSLMAAIGRERVPLSVILSPEDLAMMMPFVEKEKHRLLHIYFSSDPTVQRGDVRMECDSMLINCEVTRELESIRTHVLGVR